MVHATDKLSPKQMQFAYEYVKDFNATKAAIRAGYSERSAHSQAHDLLKKPEIRDFIGKLNQEFYSLVGLKKERLISELAQIAFDSSQNASIRIKAIDTLLEHGVSNGGEFDREESLKRNADRVLESLTRFKQKISAR